MLTDDMKLCTTSDIARAFGVCRRTVTDKWTKRPDFPQPAHRISRKTVRWRLEDVMKWAEGAQR